MYNPYLYKSLIIQPIIIALLSLDFSGFFCLIVLTIICELVNGDLVITIICELVNGDLVIIIRSIVSTLLLIHNR